jgi:uncharacterized protein (DUF2147 family)
MRRWLLGILFLAWPAAATAAADIGGNWITQDKSAVVAFGRCGTSLCGNILRILVQKPDMPKTDTRNPDPSQRTRPLQGLRILSGFRQKGDRWEGGRIYDPESGKTYASKLRLNADGTLSVSGCIAIFCKTQRWTRAR